MSKPWNQGHSNFSSVHGRDLNGAGKRPRAGGAVRRDDTVSLHRNLSHFNISGGGWGDVENQNTAPNQSTAPQASCGWPFSNSVRWKAQRRHRALPNRPGHPSARARPHQGSRGLTLNFNYWNRSPFHHQILISGIRQWVVSVFSRKDTPAFLETSQRVKKVVLVNVYGLDMTAAEEIMEMEKCPFLESCTSVPVRNTLDESDTLSRGTDVHTSGALMLWGEKPVLLSPQELTLMSLPELLRSCETNISIPRTVHWADVISFIPSSSLEESTAIVKSSSASANASVDDEAEPPESERSVVCKGSIWKNGCLDRGKFMLVSTGARGGKNEQWRSSTGLRHRGQVEHVKTWQSWKLELKWSGKGSTREDFDLRVADTDGDGLRLMDEKTGVILSVVCARRTSEEDTLLSPGGDAPAVVKIVMGSDAATSSAVRDESSPARAPPAEPTEPFAGPSDAENTEGVNGGEAHTVDVRLEELRPDAFALSEADRRRLGIPVKLEDRTFVSSGPVELQSTTSEDSGSSDEEEHEPQSKARRRSPEGLSSIDDEVEEGELCFTSGEGTQAVKSDGEQQAKNNNRSCSPSSCSTPQPPQSPPSTPKSAQSTESGLEKYPLTTLENSEPEDGEVCEDHERESDMEDKAEASHVDGDGAASGDTPVAPGRGTKPKCFVPPSKDALCPVSCGPAKGSVILGMDCEMVQTEQGQAVARVTVVNIHGEAMYDELVKPSSKVTDFLSRFSGIHPGMLRGVKRTLEDAQKELLLFIDQDTYLVGHAIVNDLRGLKLVHGRVIDTAELYPSPKGAPFTMALKVLAQSFLGRTIQEGVAGHDSKQDAYTALELALLKMSRGPEFGLPPAWGSFPCPSRQTLFDYLARTGLAPLGCRVIGETEHRSSAPGDNKGGTPQLWSIFRDGYRREEDAVWTARYFSRKAREEKDEDGRASGTSNGDKSLKGCVTVDASEHTAAREMLAAAMEAVKSGPDLVWVDAPCKDEELGYSRRSGSACRGKQWNSLQEVDEAMRSLFDCLEEDTAMAIVCQGAVSKMRGLLAKKKAASWAKNEHNSSVAGMKRSRDAAFDRQGEEQLSVLTDDCLNGMCFIAIKEAEAAASESAAVEGNAARAT